MPATVTMPALLALFKIDRDLNQLRMGLENVQKDQKRQQNKIAQLTQDLTNQDTAHKKLAAETAVRDLDMKSFPRKDWRASPYSVRTLRARLCVRKVVPTN